MPCFFFNVVEKHVLRLVLRHARNALKFLLLCVIKLADGSFFCIDRLDALCKLLLALLKGILLFVETFLLLLKSALRALQFAPPFFAFPLILGLKAVDFFFRFENGLFFQCFGALLCVGDHFFDHLVRLGDLGFCIVLVIYIFYEYSAACAENGSSDRKNYI